MLLVSGDDGENMTGDKDDYCQSGPESAESPGSVGLVTGWRREGGAGTGFMAMVSRKIMKIGCDAAVAWLSLSRLERRGRANLLSLDNGGLLNGQSI